MQVMWRAHLNEVYTDPPIDSKSVWLVRGVLFAGLEYLLRKPKEFRQPVV